MVSSCSLLPTKQIQVSTKPVERQIVQPIMPREIDLRQPEWIAVTPENWEEQLAKIEKQEGELLEAIYDSTLTVVKGIKK